MVNRKLLLLLGFVSICLISVERTVYDDHALPKTFLAGYLSKVRLHVR